MLVLSRGPEEAIVIGENVEVRVLEVHGDRVRLGILAPPEVAVHRKEVFLVIQRENRAAAAPEAAGLAQAVALMGGGGTGGGSAAPPGVSAPKAPEAAVGASSGGAGLQKEIGREGTEGRSGADRRREPPHGGVGRTEKDRRERRSWR